MSPTQTRFPAAGEIVIFQPEFVEFGGEERVILSLCRELHNQGKPHSVLCYWDHIELGSYATWPLTVNQLTPTPHQLSKVLALHRCLRYIHRVGSPTPALFSIQSAYHAGLGATSPYHIRIPDTYSLLGFGSEVDSTEPQRLVESIRSRAITKVRHFATRRGLRQAKRFVTNTIALREEMQYLYGRSAAVIYLGGFDGSHAPPPHRSSHPIELLSVSRIQSSKRIDWILHALAEIKKEGELLPDWRLHIAGSGPDMELLKGLCKAIGFGDSVIFHGFVTDQMLAQLYQQCHVFLMPATQGFGLPAIEALYQRLGLVVSEDSGVSEILGNTKWVVIARGGREGFTLALKEMLRRVGNKEFFEQPLPQLPTEESWARQIITYFEW